MKKLEKILSKYSWLFKLGVILSMLLWAAQSISLIEGIGKGKPVDWEKEKAASRELVALYEKIGNEAFKKGYAYGPKDYYEDHKRIEEGEYQIRKKYDTRATAFPEMVSTASPHFRLLDLLKMNERKGMFTRQEFDEEARKFNYYKRMNGDPSVKESREELAARGWKKNTISFLNWLLIFYLRSLLIIPFLYLVRMAERKGILETILADKKRFLKSILVWPVEIWRYPFNIVKEILVEAELRRIGNVFRKLTKREREVIRHAAENFTFRAWAREFRRRNAYRIRRSLLVAVVATLALHIALPSAGAHEGKERHDKDRCCYQQVISDDDEDHQSPTTSDGGSCDGETATPPTIPLPGVIRLNFTKSQVQKIERRDTIGHVPYSGHLGAGRFLYKPNGRSQAEAFSGIWRKLWTVRFRWQLLSSLSVIANTRLQRICSNTCRCLKDKFKEEQFGKFQIAPFDLSKNIFLIFVL